MLTIAIATSKIVRLIPSLNADRAGFMLTPWVLGGGLAVRAAPEQLETVVVDAVARSFLDLTDDGSPAGVIDISAGSAVGADDVVVMDGLAGHVGVLAAGQVEALDRAEVGQHIERAEDRGAADTEASLAGVRYQVGRREMPVASCDQVGDRAASLGESVSGVIEGVLDGDGLSHGPR
jgi:hypothetical protein